MKKLFCLILSLIIMVSLASCGGNGDTPISDENGNSNSAAEQQGGNDTDITVENLMAHEASPESDFEFGSYSETYGGDATLYVQIKGYNGSDSIVVLPETIEGKPVLAIHSYALGVHDDNSIKAIRLSNNIKKICKNAFFDNETLEIVVCGDSLKEIAGGTFSACYNLREVVLNDGIEIIGKEAFMSTDLTEITIPESVTEIGYSAFGYSETLTIKGKAGSTAEDYAKENNIKFEAIE